MPSVRTEFLVGLDLAQSDDYTAVAIAEKTTQAYSPRERSEYTYRPPPLPPPRYAIRHLDRFPLRTPYPTVVSQVKALLARGPLCLSPRTLILDATGVGAPVVDMFTAAQLPCPLVAISIHGGNKVTREGRHYFVPKRDLISAAQVLLESQRLRVAAALPTTDTFVKELKAFRVKIDLKTAHDSYEAWRENIHDDLVLAASLVCWYGEHGMGLPPVLTEVEGL
jgi:hypothetical protein